MAGNIPKQTWRQNVKKETTARVVQRPLSFSENPNLKMNPKIVGYYSINQNYEYVGDASRLKYIRKVPKHELPFDLNDKFINSGIFDQNQAFFNFLPFLKENEQVLRVVTSQLLKDAPFVCTKTTLTHFFQSKELMISACLSNNVIYLSAVTDSDPISKWNVLNGQKAAAWGLKFQQFMQTEEPGGDIDTEKLASGAERFLCVFQSQLDEHTIVYCGTVDGIRLPEKAPVKDKGDRSVLEMLKGADLVDLHTIMDNKGPNKSHSPWKTMKFWSQAYLAGVNNIVIGHRNKLGLLLSMEQSSPAKMHKAANNSWSPPTCLNLCNRTLSDVKKFLVEEASSMPLKDDLEPGKVSIEMFFRRQGDHLVQVTSGTENFPKVRCDQLI